ncbi:MAG: hypothetical protein OEZ28_09390, partial [Nitrospinota bacterium]|nr:hypothetical protein [Nitrospinota bacterium]
MSRNLWASVLAVATLVTVSFIISCGSSSTDSPAPGRAVKGPIVGGAVAVFDFSSGAQGALLETATTGADGRFSLQNTYSFPIQITITGGVFIDEATGAQTDMGNQSIMALFPYGVGKDESPAVTLLTHAAAVDALTRIANGQDPVAAMERANAQLSFEMGLNGADITKTIPFDLTNPEEGATPGAAADYAAALAALSWYGMENGLSPMDLVALAECIGKDLADEILDGQSFGEGCQGGYDPKTAVDNREANADRFLDSPQNKSGVGAGDVSLDDGVGGGGGGGGGGKKPPVAPGPNAFGFTNLTGQALNTPVTEGGATLTGMSKPGTISIAGDASCQYSLDGGATWTAAAGTIAANGTFDVRVTSANAASTAVSCMVTVNAVSATWTVTTGSSVPAQFTFTDVIDAPLNTPYTSNTVTLTGMTLPSTATLVGAGCTMSVDGGGYGAGPTAILANGTITVKV